jgi:hypothetical protein
VRIISGALAVDLLRNPFVMVHTVDQELPLWLFL